MKKSEIIKIVKSCLSTQKINEKSSSNNTPEWDSLGNLSIMSKIDKITKGKASKMNINNADSIAKLYKILKKK
jgi:acyl carrier protein